ncbi:MAG TPA: YbhB/YbcL family Raf kinase inhibitor-like protein [Caulobacteraceae bacterium]|nr:YbhB/YbcL family Raf kinase inhibitor-like protein [Caulobacteraceae bacterium]
MKTPLLIAAFAAASGLTAASAALAQALPPPAKEVSADKLVINMFPAKGGAKLKVTTPAFKDGGDIPFENTLYRGNHFPGLSWSKGPKATQTYAIVMQDGDGAHGGDAVLHWTMYNISARTTSLEPNLADPPPPGAAYGPNVLGPHHIYEGPRTPPGPRHRYHLQVFALDTPISVDPNLSYDGLKAAIKDHVLASGQVIGMGLADPTAPPRPK